MYIKPTRLQAGDEIRVIAPSQSMSIIDEHCQQKAYERLNQLGFKVSFGQYCLSNRAFNSAANEEKITDLHDAFADPNVKGILTTIGGFNTNQLLDKIDYNLIAKNPKVFCGYSDITALQNAILTKSNLITYSGPHFSTFGMTMSAGLDWITDHFLRVVSQATLREISPSPNWWDTNQNPLQLMPNEGYWLLNKGQATGTIIGGNLSTLCLLCGTSYFPSLKDSILFLEDDFESHAGLFERQFQQLLMQSDFNQVRAIVFGRFQTASNIGLKQLMQMIANKSPLKHIPIIANADFGHTVPFFTFPIGGQAKLIADSSKIQLHVD